MLMPMRARGGQRKCIQRRRERKAGDGDQQRRRHAEGDGVRHAVEVVAEAARPRRASDDPIGHVTERTAADQSHRQLEFVRLDAVGEQESAVQRGAAEAV
jgi:hypothetical protein